MPAPPAMRARRAGRRARLPARRPRPRSPRRHTHGARGRRMADSGQLRRLVAYNQWADERILTALDGVPAEELSPAARGVLRRPSRRTSATRSWRSATGSRGGGARRRRTRPSRSPGARPTRRRTRPSGVRRRALRRRRRSGCSATRIFAGTPARSCWPYSIMHVVNHGTGHRAETGLLLERLGRSPGDLDYIYYCSEHP